MKLRPAEEVMQEVTDLGIDGLSFVRVSNPDVIAWLGLFKAFGTSDITQERLGSMAKFLATGDTDGNYSKINLFFYIMLNGIEIGRFVLYRSSQDIVTFISYVVMLPTKESIGILEALDNYIKNNYALDRKINPIVYPITVSSEDIILNGAYYLSPVPYTGSPVRNDAVGLMDSDLTGVVEYREHIKNVIKNQREGTGSGLALADERYRNGLIRQYDIIEILPTKETMSVGDVRLIRLYNDSNTDTVGITLYEEITGLRKIILNHFVNTSDSRLIYNASSTSEVKMLEVCDGWFAAGLVDESFSKSIAVSFVHDKNIDSAAIKKELTESVEKYVSELCKDSSFTITRPNDGVLDGNTK